MSGAAADIRRAEPLRHNALAAELAGVAVDDVAAVLEVLDQPQPDPAAAQQARQRRLARLQRLAPQVLAIQLKEVEGVRCIPLNINERYSALLSMVRLGFRDGDLTSRDVIPSRGAKGAMPDTAQIPGGSR